MSPREAFLGNDRGSAGPTVIARPASWGRRAGLTLAAALCLTLAAHGAKSDKPNKAEKPAKVSDVDKVKPDKVKPEKIERSDKTPKSERSVQAVAPARSERSSKFGRSSERSSGGTAAAPAPGPATPAGRQFDDFQVVIERNIFNPNRVARVRGNNVEPPRVDVVTLVGVLQSDTGVIAFFDSPDRSFPKTLREGETIGGLPLARIAPNGVQLMQEGEALFLRVSQQMRRTDGGSWRAIPRDFGRSEVARTSDPSAAIPPGASEVLRRLMEQRQKQLKQ